MYPEDCESCNQSCLPWWGLLVTLGKVRTEDLPVTSQAAVEVTARQAADPRRFAASKEREEAAVALGLSPVEMVVVRAHDQAKARTRARRSKAAREHWARMTPEERKTQARGITGPHRRGAQKP